jgi:hypothetical protein
MENKLEEVERDYIEFRKEIEEGDDREGEKKNIKKNKSHAKDSIKDK